MLYIYMPYIKKETYNREPYGGKGSRGPYGPRKHNKNKIIKKKKIKKSICIEINAVLIFD